MDRSPKRHGAAADGESLPDQELQGAGEEEVRNRQAAASYLRAAKLTDNAAERGYLRRQAAELLSPRTNDRASPTPGSATDRGPRS